MKDQFRRILCNFLAFLILCPPQLLASGGIQVDAAAPARNRASLDAAQNGVPVVNIARPNGGGLSHNKFSEFNVDTRGVIINNSVRPGVSQLGGTLTPNGNLGGRAASTILNEVTGTGRTRLDGYTEIFGARADYILANPNGISINGGGFINTPSVTLSTGRPRLEADALTALDVAGGDILVEGQGVNADNVDAFTLVTRAARINADIHARHLDIVTGRNRYNPADGSVTALAPDGNGAPAVSIDSSVLGGMYAGRIRLVGTEKGVGVNLQGLARATEDIFLQADGDISVQGGASADRALSVTSESGDVGIGGSLAAGGSGAVTAAGAVRLGSTTGGSPVLYASDLSVTAGSLDNAGGRIMAEGELRASVGGEAANSGVMQSGVGMVVNAGGAVRNSGEMLAGEGLDVAAGGGVANSGTMHAGGAAAVRSAQGVANGGDMLAGESLSVEAGADIANTGRLQSGGSVSVRTAGGLENGGEILAEGPVELESAGAAANTGAVRSEAGVRVGSQALANSGAVEAGGDLSLAVTAALENSGTLFSGGDAGLRAGNVRNEAAGRVASLGSLSVETGADIENSGSFGAGNTLGVHAGGSLRNAGEMLASSSLEVESRGSLENTGVLHSGGSGSCRAGTFLANSGDIMGVGDLFLGVASDMRNSGVIQSAGNIVFSLGGGLLNSGGILSRGSLDLDLPGDAVNTGVLGGDTDVALRAGGSLRNSAGARMLAGNGLDVNVRTGVENAGLMSSGGTLCAGTAGGVANTGDMLAGAGLAVDAGTDVGNEGRLHSGGAVAVRAAGDLSNSGEVLAKGGVNVGVGGSLANAGTVSVEAGARVEAGTLSNEGVMEAGGGLAAAVAGSLENLGRLFSGKTLEVLAGAMRNLASGVMESLGGTRVTADADIENAGSIAAGESLVVRGGGSLRNTGDVRAQSAFDAAVSGSVENAGSVQSGGGISVNSVASLSNSGEVLAVGDAAFGVGGDLSNTGVLHSGGASSYELGGGLGNDGRILAHGTLNMIMAGDAGNTGLMAGDADVSLHVGGVLFNAVVGELVSGGNMAVSTGEDLRNQGRAEAGGSGAYAVGGGLFNDGRMLALTGLAFDVAGLADNPGVLHSGDGLAFAAAGLVNGGQILAQGDGGLSIGGDLTNTGFLFAGGAAAYGVDGLLHNNRGQILSLGDMLLAGTAGSMAGLLNEAGTIESLEGSMSIRAASVRNENPDFVLTPGTDIISRSGGIYSFFSDNWDQAQDLYEMLPSAAEVSSSRNALIIVPAELTVLGLGLDRNAFPRAELDTAIAAAEERFAASGGTPEEVATVASLKNRLINKKINVAVQHFKDRSKVAAYIESVTRDAVSGQAGGATIAAAGNLDIEAQSFLNSVSTVSTASGDIRIDTATFSNAGQEVYEHRTIEWARGHANEHQSPRLAKEGGGVEVVDTPVGHAYGVISASGDVVITADHLANGIAGNAGLPVSGAPGAAYSGGVDSQGAVAAPAGPLSDAPSVGGVGLGSGPQASVIAPPRPEDLSPSVGNLEDLIGDLPTDGLFSVNTSPGHRYLIETNPALTSMSRFYGSDYFLDRLDVDLAATQRQLLGDAFYETRLVRDQIFALTGRRLLSSAFTSDAQQMRALLDNAVAVQGGLGLSVGVSLTAEQVAALDTDIVWLETRVVDGHEVLAPVVYLCSGSLETIARGGAVIVARNVDVNTTGDTVNGGVIQALGELAVTARNIFNSFGTLQGCTVNLAATETLRNTSGLIQGGDVSITAGRDIINDTASTAFSQSETTRPTFAFRGPVSGAPGAGLFGPSTSSQTTSETVGRRGAIEATGDLAMQAGNDIAIEGGDVRAGGDISMKAGGDALISAQNLESHSTGKTGSAKSGYDTRTGKSSTVAAGGSVDIAADGNVVVHGSTVTAGEDATVAAGESVSVMAATEGYEYRFKQSKNGGMFGTSTAESMHARVTSGVAAAITAGDRVVIEAGKGGAGDVTVVGSRVESGGDMDLRARDGILVSSSQKSQSVASASSESNLIGSKAEASGDVRVDQVGSEVVAGNDLNAQARNVAVSASRVHAGNNAAITSTESDVIVSGAQNTVSTYRYEKEDGWNLSAPLELPLAILVGGAVEFYNSKMQEAKNAVSSNGGSRITAGNNVEIDSARDVAVIGSTVAAGHDVTLDAVRDTNLIPGLTAQAKERRTEETSIGLSSLSISENEIKGFAGVTKSETGSSFTGDYNAASVISAGNDVHIEAGNNVNQFSSGIEAGRDARLASGNDVNVDADQDIEHMENYAREIQIGVTASARQSVTTAARTLADTPGNMAAGEGSDAAKGITAASAILRGVSAAQQLTNVGASASITAGASVSESSSFMDAADAATSSIQAGRDVEFDAERDVKVTGAAVLAAEDVTIEAGRDVAITSATNTYSAGADSFSASAGVGVGASYSAQGGAAAGIRVQADAAGSKNTSRAQIHTNSAVAAGETLTVTSGADTTVAGANLEGKNVAMDVGGDLVVKSEQDKRAAAGSNWNAGGSVTFGYGFSAEAHVGMGKSSANSAWVNRQTSVIGQEGVDISTEKNTHVEGAVIAAENGNLRLDTGTLTYKDIKDKDTSKGFQVSLSGSYASGGSNAQGGNSTVSGALDGSYRSSDRRQINRATIGEGEIIIRSDPANGLEGLNRDLRRAQEITKDEQTSVVVYVDSSAIKEITSGFAGIRGNLEALGELVKKVLPDDARLRDSVANQLSLKEKLIESGKSAEEAEALVQKYALYADLLGEIGKLVDAKGGWDNLTDAEAQEFLGSLMMDSRFVTLVASSDDSLLDSLGIVVSSGKFVLGAVVGGLEAAGSDAKSALFFLNDMSGYMLNKVSGGYLYQQEARNFTNTVNDFVNGIGYLVQHADEVGPAIVAGLEKKWNDYLTAFETEDYYEAGRLYGEFYYQISMLLIAGQGVAKSIMSGLKSAAPKFAATVEAAEAARVAKFGDEAVGVASKSVPQITFKPKWSGQVQRYRNGDMTAMEHITSRHGYNSGYSNVSKFSEGTSIKNIKSMVDEAAARGTFTQTRTGSTITYDFGHTIGTNQVGQSTSRITIHLDSSGSVRTAYPY